ncbi:hypothetical protein [Leptospira chreensis]|uniref:hypothetical protein n=1 Tax=Leptospira chreensis TaxID=2810035 RepID=UPI001E4060B7|nr:hypothetical protein [Leptospira chreensis]
MIAALTTGCTLFGEPKQNQQMRPLEEKQPMFKEGEYIFSSKEGVSLEELRSLFNEFGIIKLDSLVVHDRTYLLVLKEDPGLTILEKKATTSGKIRYIERNGILQKYNSKP